jgi:hypothetical protein
MEGVAPGERRPITLTNLPDGLVGTLGIRVEDADNVVIQSRTTSGITEFATGSYRVWVTFPEAKGFVYVIGDDGAGAEAIEEFRVTTDPLALIADPLEVDWAPALVEVAALVRTRTRDDDGNYLGTFTADTSVTAEEVEALAHYATASVATQIGLSPCSATLKARARGMASLYTAMLIELSYFPEQVGSDRSPYAKYKELFDDGMPALIEAVAENCGGGGGGESVGGAGPMPSSSFPPPSGIGEACW